MSPQEQLRRFGIDFFCALRISWPEEIIPTDKRLDHSLEKAINETGYIPPVKLNFVTARTGRQCCELDDIKGAAYDAGIISPEPFGQGSDRYMITQKCARQMIRERKDHTELLTLTYRIAKIYLPQEKQTMRV